MTKNNHPESQQFTFGQFILGLEGLAILRSSLLDAPTVKMSAEKIAEIALQLNESPWSNPVEAVERTVTDGYGEWAPSYDQTSSPPILAEEPVVHSLLAKYPLGTALDAACGTGRHSAYLASLGHRVIGIDATPEMLEVAKSKVPAAQFKVGDLTSLPLPDNSIDLAVCSLALTHCPDLSPPIAELSRALKPGGAAIISDVHPFLVMLGAHADFRSDRAGKAFVRNRIHLPSAYISAFKDAGLRIVQCIETLYGDREIAAMGFAEQINNVRLDGLMEAAVKGIPNVIIWELAKSE